MRCCIGELRKRKRRGRDKNDCGSESCRRGSVNENERGSCGLGVCKRRSVSGKRQRTWNDKGERMKSEKDSVDWRRSGSDECGSLGLVSAAREQESAGSVREKAYPGRCIFLLVQI